MHFEYLTEYLKVSEEICPITVVKLHKCLLTHFLSPPKVCNTLLWMISAPCLGQRWRDYYIPSRHVETELMSCYKLGVHGYVNTIRKEVALYLVFTFTIRTLSIITTCVLSQDPQIHISGLIIRNIVSSCLPHLAMASPRQWSASKNVSPRLFRTPCKAYL